MKIVDEFLKGRPHEHSKDALVAFVPWLRKMDMSFIAHVQSHLKPGETVVCKICGREAIDTQPRPAANYLDEYAETHHEDVDAVAYTEWLIERGYIVCS